ncbi:MAG TPA: hypothetical protein ENK80_01630 [Rhodobacterales bacterium]|nr:hypothetical protein [Rhodobacterales bacterium]
MEIAARLTKEYGRPKGAADAVWARACDNLWYREGEKAERFLLYDAVPIEADNEAAIAFAVAWQGHPIGHLSHDGFEW